MSHYVTELNGFFECFGRVLALAQGDILSSPCVMTARGEAIFH